MYTRFKSRGSFDWEIRQNVYLSGKYKSETQEVGQGIIFQPARKGSQGVSSLAVPHYRHRWAGTSILRRSGEECSRNSAKKLGVTYGRCLATINLVAAAKEYLATVYLKHRSLQNRKVKYRG